jgi:hypothetical protein
VHGHRVKDLPGVKYRVVRGYGSKNFSETKLRSRSKYGVKKAYLNKVVHIRKRSFFEMADPRTGVIRRMRGVGLTISARHHNTVA